MSQTPAGWYPDPEAPPGFTPLLRWWDGYQWTDHRQPAPSATPQRTSGPTTPDGRVLGGWWRRVLAYLVDSIIGSIAAYVLSFPAQVEYQRMVQSEVERLEERTVDGDPAALDEFWQAVAAFATEHWLSFFLVPVMVVAAYHVLFLRWRGATLGKLMIDLRVEPADGPGRLRWSTIAVRVGLQYAVVWVVLAVTVPVGDIGLVGAAYTVVIVLWLVDALWAAGRRRRALHDLVAGTVVVRPR